MRSTWIHVLTMLLTASVLGLAVTGCESRRREWDLEESDCAAGRRYSYYFSDSSDDSTWHTIYDGPEAAVAAAEQDTCRDLVVLPSFVAACCTPD